ncbi:protease modulator HflK [Sphingomonas cannabina]|uniref:protease modulator HflK n=1 Tax=Sphingomonas cannabina TaxID=2899123 RepID=UPI001F3A91E6|nr:protease modulator HflK [Sphingomonas cannabina]UIJ45320.1 protease modulator HflK [Sphingomonas cannabina]
MNILSGWRARGHILRNEPPKSPWGGKPTGGGDDSGKGGDDSGKGGGGGPRNPWSFPPEGRRSRPGSVSSLDEFLKRARGGGGGPGLPGGVSGRSLWLIGVGLIVALWVLFTSIWQIAPQERGVVTFFGRYAGVLEPGIHLTLPSPFNNVEKIDVQNIREETFPTSSSEENLMLTGDQNIINLAYQVRWNIGNPQDYVFQIRDPKETVRATAESVMRAVVADVDLDQALGRGRTVIEARVQQLMQETLDEYNSGVRIQGVAISKADPPNAVNDDFKAVSAAQQEAQSNLNNARAYAQQVIARAQGEAAQFDKIYEQYKLSPDVTKRRLYYETMEAVLAKSNKTIVEAPGVTPYLPLPEARRTIPDAQTPPAVQQGGAQ